jgi:acetyl esterase/lipase
MSAAIPASLRSLMAEIGPRWGADTSGNVRRVIDEFSLVLAHAPKLGAIVARDIAYGPHPRQAFDLYTPEAPGQGRPALIFVHGGAFTDGNRNRTNEIYSNVGWYFARHGIVTINTGYRLAPEIMFPESSRDIGKVVAWARANARDIGIDGKRVFLMGHSAGGAHVATYAYDSRAQNPGGPNLAGLVVLSGRVRADNLLENPNARRVEAYYGADASVYDDRSPVTHVAPDSVPTFIAWAEFENPLLDVYCAELTWRLGLAKRRTPPIMWLKGHNHSSLIAHINTEEDALGAAIRAFIADPH